MGKKSQGKKIPSFSQKGDISPETEQDDNGQTFGKTALVQSWDQPSSEDYVFPEVFPISDTGADSDGQTIQIPLSFESPGLEPSLQVNN